MPAGVFPCACGSHPPGTTRPERGAFRLYANQAVQAGPRCGVPDPSQRPRPSGTVQVRRMVQDVLQTHNVDIRLHFPVPIRPDDSR